MNSQLNHLIAQERAADLARIAERARVAENYDATESTSSPAGRTARALARLRLLLRGARASAAVEG